MEQKVEAKSFVRRDKLISLESRARGIWDRNQYFSVEPSEKPKFFMTFPYAYMNGLLHLGHAFTMSKCDFNAWYKRLSGFNVLFPFGYHCTGMPISAAAKKLGFEIEKYGSVSAIPTDINSQCKILKQMGIEEQDIPKFTNPEFWVSYFPPLGQKHLKQYGVHVDHARSFITTELNPYYNSFIEWQFNLLKARGYIKFGKRPSIYSPIDKQMCADHDRQQGQGQTPQEYTLIKIKVLQLNERMKKTLQGRNVFLVAATLRPQTMYGQTCCYLLPTGEYSAVQAKNGQVFICSERSARNMAYQGLTKQDQVVNILDKFTGEQLMGLPLKAPLSPYEKVYTLPMMTISMKKGTGVVTCVPSDSPDDWMAISDLRAKKALREKYNITEEMVNLNPVEIINIPTYGNLTALAVCEKMKIKSQNDKEALVQAKDQCYKKGFHEGKMIIGKYAGHKVADAKPLVRKDLIESNEALIYYEPTGNVVSRSGDVCVVSYCEQWYINYADEEWKKRVMNHVKTNFKCNSETLYNDLLYTIDWLKEWGCSRSFGLGTKLPFDPQYLIESLSDSTIYMAFYTIAHLLQGNLNGSEVGILGIRHQDITPDFWDYVFLGKPYTSGKIAQYKLDQLRNSFLYWYPLDIRCSGKDLIKNHLTMSLFNHAAIWQNEPEKWPRSFFCNGFIKVENEKMSKSLGNFITLKDAITLYGADATRMACAQAGDSIDDANFTQETANAAILQLSTLEMYLGKVLEEGKNYRNQDNTDEDVAEFDTIFESEIENQIEKVRNAYESMTYRDVIKFGFHEFVSIKDSYLINCGKSKPRADLIERYIYLQLLFIYPIVPHFCEVSYIDYFLSFSKDPKSYPRLLGDCSFPKAIKEINYSAIRSHQYMSKFLSNAREMQKKMIKAKKGKAQFKKATVIYREKYQDYQIEVLNLLKSCIVDGAIRPDWRNEVKIADKDAKTKALKFGAYIAEEYKVFGQQALEQVLIFNEKRTLDKFINVLKSQLAVDVEVEIFLFRLSKLPMLLRDRVKTGKKLLMELHLETQQLSSIENDSSIIVKMFKFLDENVCIIIKLFILQFYYSMSEKFGYEQWKKMTIQLNRTKQITEQMSKFYIIAHEKVKAIMRKCQINPLYDPTEDSKNQLDFIKQVLVRLAHRNEDQYLSKIDPSSLDKYQRSFHDLLDLLHLVLHTHKSQSNLEISKLMRLTQDKDKKKSQYGLIGELKKSQHRVIRSKSGSRLSNHRASVNQQYNYANGAETQREKSSHSQLLVFPSAKTHIKQYLERKTNLEGIISKQIEKQGMGVSYEKKYRDNNFQEYFNHRKEFMELILSQKYYQNLTKVAQNRQNQSKVSEKNEQNLNKLFPDFNIKTKYMKRQVRENIMQVIFDVKKQILKEFHESNVKKMKEDSEQKMGQKKQSKRRVFKKSVSTTFIPEPPRSSLDDCPRFQSTNRKMSDRSQLPQKRRSSLFLKYEPSKQIVDPVWKKGEGVVQMQKRAGSVLNANKIPSYPL